MKKKAINDIVKIQRYQNEGRGDWWFMPLWKKIIYVIGFPLVVIWLSLCYCIMKIGRGIYQFGDLLSGWRWDGDWLQEL